MGQWYLLSLKVCISNSGPFIWTFCIPKTVRTHIQLPVLIPSWVLCAPWLVASAMHCGSSFRSIFILQINPFLVYFSFFYVLHLYNHLRVSPDSSVKLCLDDHLVMGGFESRKNLFIYVRIRLHSMSLFHTLVYWGASGQWYS